MNANDIVEGGWIENTGGCPAEKGTALDILFNDGDIVTDIPALTYPSGKYRLAYEWALDNFPWSITHWRLHKSVEDISPAEKLVRLYAEKSGSELLRTEASSEPSKAHSHYFKDVSNLSHIDVYRVLSLFNVTDPCLQHSIKKLLVAGGRGAGKDIGQDVQEALDSLERWKSMREEDNEQT